MSDITPIFLSNDERNLLMDALNILETDEESTWSYEQIQVLYERLRAAS